jgi:hypothetical protein
MPSFKLLAFTKPVEGREDEYNSWYSDTHLPDVLRVPGILTAQRFRVTDSQKNGPAQPWEYLAIYDCEADSVQQIVDGIGTRAGTSEMLVSSALSAESYVCYFEPMTELMRRKA